MFKKFLLKILIKITNPYKRAKIFEYIGVRMGDNCQVFPNVSFGSEPYLIELGDNVKITDGCKFITHDGGVEVLRNLNLPKDIDVFGRIIIGNNVFVGNNCHILSGVTIGNNVIIGSGSVVTKDIESNTVVAGVPAKRIKSLDEYKSKVEIFMDRTKGMSFNEKKMYLEKKYNLKSH